MSSTVYKYKLEQPFLATDIEVPYPATPLSVAIQDNDICVWFLVDPEGHKIKVKLIALPTGVGLPEAEEIRRCLGVCHLDKIIGEGVFTKIEKAVEVYHVFELMQE